MTLHYRKRRISELSLRFMPTELPGNKHFVVDVEKGGEQVAGPYDSAEQARTQCRMMLADEIEQLYLPPEANFRARVATIIREHTDPEWAARLIWDYAAGAKA